MKAEATQDAFLIIRELATLCATQGVNNTTQTMANEQIQELITKIIRPAVTELSANSRGIIV